MVMESAPLPPPERRQPFAIVDRETFFAAIDRHRRASWRVTAACAVAVAVLATVVAMLMAPLFYCAIGLAFDVTNLFTPAPDILGWMGRQIDAITNSNVVPPADVVRTAILVAAPGAAMMAAAAYALRHVWISSPVVAGGDALGRPPDRTVLAEERLANVVEEMAIAAGIAPPRVLIVPGGINASASGADDAHVTVLVGEGALARIGREQLEGMIAHLIGSVVDGDMPIGVRVATTLSLFGLLARIGSSFTDRRAGAYVVSLWRVLVAPRSELAQAALTALTRPFDDSDGGPRRHAPPTAGTSGLTWREWLTMPLMGPLFFSGFLSGMVSQLFLAPLIAFAWRQRKYMADATAVQLTRDPDALAGALAAIVDSPTAIASWTAHLAVAADRRGEGGLFGSSIVPIFPSIEKRVAALRRMGAHVSLKPRPPMPWWLLAVFGVLGSIVVALLSVVVFLLVFVSTAISGLFTIFPAAALHFILRWAAR